MCYYVKSKYRTNLSDEHLQASLLIETTKFVANYQYILKVKQFQTYHKVTSNIFVLLCKVIFNQYKQWLLKQLIYIFIFLIILTLSKQCWPVMPKSISQIWPTVKKGCMETPELYYNDQRAEFVINIQILIVVFRRLIDDPWTCQKISDEI